MRKRSEPASVRRLHLRIANLWLAGNDTTQIARQIGAPITEAYVYGTLARVAGDKIRTGRRALTHRDRIEAAIVAAGEVSHVGVRFADVRGVVSEDLEGRDGRA
jgi:hypothetical protein